MYKVITDIKTNKVDSIVVLVKSISTLRARNDAIYQKVHVRDQSGAETTFMVFDVLLEVQTPIIMEMRVECVEYGANASIKIQEAREVSGYSISSFMPKAKMDYKAGWSAVIKAIKPLNPWIGKLVCSIISENKNKFLYLPLNPIGAFARQSGNLEATVKLVSLAETTYADNPDMLDHDLMVAGALLYYSGSLDTVDEGYEHTVTDLMYGSSVASYTNVQMKITELAADNQDFIKEADFEKIMMLSHILVAKGGAVKPAIPEAAALMRLDTMIQEIDAMNESIKGSIETIVMAKPQGYYGKRFYKRESQVQSGNQES